MLINPSAEKMARILHCESACIDNFRFVEVEDLRRDKPYIWKLDGGLGKVVKPAGVKDDIIVRDDNKFSFGDLKSLVKASPKAQVRIVFDQLDSGIILFQIGYTPVGGIIVDNNDFEVSINLLKERSEARGQVRETVIVNEYHTYQREVRGRVFHNRYYRAQERRLRISN